MNKTALLSTIIATAYMTASCEKAETPAASGEDSAEIGSTLNGKTDISISALPDGVLEAAKAVRPNVNFTDAEQEIRNGVIYFDLAGENESGEEIEIDIMQDGDGWRVVEVQRDISFDETPAPVKAALLANAPEITPARIIESDQTDGVIIYEFYTRDAKGVEAKFEVKLEDGQAQFLTEEWVH